jgi:hypothetical protein
LLTNLWNLTTFIKVNKKVTEGYKSYKKLQKSYKKLHKRSEPHAVATAQTRLFCDCGRSRMRFHRNYHITYAVSPQRLISLRSKPHAVSPQLSHNICGFTAKTYISAVKTACSCTATRPHLKKGWTWLLPTFFGLEALAIIGFLWLLLVLPWFSCVFEGLRNPLLVEGHLKQVGRGPTQPPNLNHPNFKMRLHRKEYIRVP